MAVSPDGKLLAFAARRGVVMLLNATTKQWVADLSSSAPVADLKFTANGQQLFTLSGAVYNRRCPGPPG